MKRTLSGFTALCCALMAATIALAETRAITEKDLFQFQWIGDPQLRPDGEAAAYVGVTVDEKRTDYETSLWQVSTKTGEAHRLTTAKRDASPRWSPDGRYLAFLRAAEKDGKPQPAQLFVLPMEGGEPLQLTKLPKGVSEPAWSKDGNSIAFLSATNDQDLAIAACEAAKDTDKGKCKPLRETDVQVVTRAQYRLNGQGYLDFAHPTHVWTVAFAPEAQTAPSPKQLTRGEFMETDLAWAPDGSRIYFASDHDLEPYYELPKTTIYSVPATGGDTAEVARFAGELGKISVSPQGDRLAFLGSLSKPVQSYRKTELWVVDVAGGAAQKNLSARYDWGIGGGIISDSDPPRAGGESRPAWSTDGRSITLVVAKEGRANLERIDAASGAVSAVTSGDHAVTHFTSNGRDYVARISTPTNLNDLYHVTSDGAAPKRLTHVNEKLFSSLNLTEPKDIRYKSFDGKKIHALVQLPPDFDAHRKYPLILNIHGGPHAAYGYTFFHEMQWMAAKGYVVLYPNPRGSTTYGEGFGNIIQYKYPGDDYKDLMAGVDELINAGYVDQTRLGVTGGSGGGLLTNWVIGHTDRFAAAVAQRDIADWTAWWYTADIIFFHENWFRAPPFENSTQFRERSPITYINKVKTPTMFILGDADSRTPPETGGDEMFRALKYRKVPTAMVRFPAETHELSRNGKPWHRVERLEHIVNWFDVYLMHKPSNEYDLVPPAVPDLRSAAGVN
jgi:dipeptidyl aminopeptidase/acylaminoacyl peptidase